MSKSSTSTQATAASASAPVELMPPSMTLRLGKRRLTLTWRARRVLPELLAGLLRRSWRRLLAPSLRVSIAAAAVCGAWQAPVLAAAPAANTLPTGWSVVNGNVVFTQNGNVLNINQLSPQAIANFLSFSIGSSATVNINQAASAAFLARVTGGDISQIYGKLTAQGTVVLYNPNGLVIGPGGIVDVGRFIGTTLNISDSDFLAGKLNFAKAGVAGVVDNQGTIQSATGGSVYLIGSGVSNSGVIKSAQGEVILAAGETVTLADTATPGVTVNVTGSAGNITNLGAITAEAGRIGIAAGLINNSGSISASSVVREGGRIFLRASNNLTTAATSSITADGTTGGNITLYADHSAYIDGDVSAIGTAGHGGFVETSGLASLDVVKVPTVGAGGTWYIDPYDLTVVSDSGSGTNETVSNCGTLHVITSNSTGSTIVNSTIEALLNNGTSVSLVTASSGSDAGDITVNANISKTAGAGANLTLNAANNISINSYIESTNGSLNVSLTTDYYGSGGNGNVVTLSGYNHINTNGGNLTVSDGGSSSGNGSLLMTSCGSIDMSNGGAFKVGNLTVGGVASGVTLGNGASLVAGNLSVTSGSHVDADSANVTVGNVDNSGNITLTDSTLTINGTFENKDGANLMTGGMTNIVLNGNLNSHGGANVGFGYADYADGTTNITGCGTVTIDGGSMTVGGISTSDGFSASGYNHTLNMTNAGGLTVTGNGGFTIGDSDSAAKPTVFVRNLVINAGDDNVANVTVNSGNLTVSTQTVISDSGDLYVYGGNVTLNGSVTTLDSGYITVDGGNLRATNLSLGYGLDVYSGSNVTLNGTTTMSSSSFLWTNGGNVTINGNASMNGEMQALSSANVTINANLSGNGTLIIGKGLDNDDGGSDRFSSLVAVQNNPTVTLANASSNLRVQINDGTLNITGAVRVSNLTLANVSTVNGLTGSSLDVAENLTQSSGSTMTLANASLNSSCGSLAVGNITATNLVLQSEYDDITQNAGTTLHVTKQLIAKAVSGINLSGGDNSDTIVGDGPHNQIAAFAANNSGTGDITLFNTLNTTDASVVTLNGINTATGNISINNVGGITTTALGSNANFLSSFAANPNGVTVTGATRLAQLAINTNGQIKTASGGASVVTHSPLTIGSGGVSASGTITLTAGTSGGSSSSLIINGQVVSLGGGITLSAGDSMTINANISTSPPGVALLSVPTGVVIGYATGVSITDANGVTTPVPATTTSSSNTSASQLAVNQQQGQTTTALQNTVSSTQSQNQQSTNTTIVTTTTDGTQTTGGAPGTFGGEADDKKSTKLYCS